MGLQCWIPYRNMPYKLVRSQGAELTLQMQIQIGRLTLHRDPCSMGALLLYLMPQKAAGAALPGVAACAEGCTAGVSCCRAAATKCEGKAAAAADCMGAAARAACGSCTGCAAAGGTEVTSGCVMAAMKDCGARALRAVPGCAWGVREYTAPWLGVLTGNTGEATGGDGPNGMVVLMVRPLPPAGTANRASSQDKGTSHPDLHLHASAALPEKIQAGKPWTRSPNQG